MAWNLATFLLKMSIYAQLVVCRQKKNCEYIIWSTKACKYIQQFILLKEENKPKEKSTLNKKRAKHSECILLCLQWSL